MKKATYVRQKCQTYRYLRDLWNKLSVGVRQLVERTGAVVKEMDFCAVVLVTVKRVETMWRNIQIVRRVTPRVKRITLMTNLDRTSQGVVYKINSTDRLRAYLLLIFFLSF